MNFKTRLLKLRARLHGDLIQFNRQSRQLTVYFPETSVEKVAKSIKLDAHNEVSLERTPSNWSGGPWCIVLRSTHTERVHMLEEHIPKVSDPLVTFNNESDARNAMTLISLATESNLAKHVPNPQVAPLGQQGKVGSRSDSTQNQRPRSTLRFIGASFLAGFAMLAVLLVGSALFLVKPPLQAPSNISNIPVTPAMQPGVATSLHYGPGKNDPKSSVYVFSDPNCPDCIRMQQTIKDLAKDGFDVYVFPLGVLPGSRDKVTQVMCSTNREAAWLGEASSKLTTCPGADASELNFQLFSAFGFTNAPTVILANGVITAGYRSSAEIKRLNAEQVALK